MKTKICTKCGKDKKLSEFCKDKKTLDSYNYSCKECNNIRVKLWRDTNKTHIKKYKKEYNDKNRDILKAKGKKYYEENKEECLKRVSTHKKNNLDYYKKYMKEYQNQTENKEKRNKRIKTRNKNDIHFRLRNNLGSRLRQAIKHHSKDFSTMFLIGCEIDFLMCYLQKQFLEGMTWDNHGMYGWHIDHIRPCASFDLSNPEDQHKCFHYTNLQPLWAIDNLKKGSNYSLQ